MLYNNVGFISQDSKGVASERTENRRFRLHHFRLTPNIQGTPTNIRINLILSETIESLRYISVADSA